jgi:hypothetical protein
MHIGRKQRVIEVELRPRVALTEVDQEAPREVVPVDEEVEES